MTESVFQFQFFDGCVTNWLERFHMWNYVCCSKARGVFSIYNPGLDFRNVFQLNFYFV